MYRSNMEFPDSFLPRRIARAADAEMAAVLEEDWTRRENAALKAFHASARRGRR